MGPKIKFKLPKVGSPNRKNPSLVRNKLGCPDFRTGSPAITAGQWKGAVKPGEVLNPYGCLGRKKGFWKHGVLVGSRDASMLKKKKRKRAKIEAHKKLILEAREIQDIARSHVPDALTVIAKIVSNEHAPLHARIAAATLLIERGYGKSPQTNINANVNTDGKESEIDKTELDRRTADALRRVEELTGGAGKKKARLN